ncbi:MAG: hypothetical protein M1462_08770 [Candidatus Thermoplasmatota archaeon]|nr:hypothetical protein [Candidatus Thermoplasmatota archaeon]
MKSTKGKQKLAQRYTYIPADVSHGKSIIAEGGETKMNINIKKVKLVKYGEGLRLTIQFLSTLPYGISLEGVR